MKNVKWFQGFKRFQSLKPSVNQACKEFQSLVSRFQASRYIFLYTLIILIDSYTLFSEILKP